MKSDSRPPRILDQIIEIMFPFAALGRFDFDARLLSIESIDDAKYEGSEDSKPDPTNDEGHGRTAPDDKAHNRDLVWCDSRFAKK